MLITKIASGSGFVKATRVSGESKDAEKSTEELSKHLIAQQQTM
jgi:hypothetical protein